MTQKDECSVLSLRDKYGVTTRLIMKLQSMTFWALLIYAAIGSFALASPMPDNTLYGRPPVNTALVQASNVVTQAYRDVLRRDPDPGGLSTFTQQLMDGKTEQWLRTVLRNSPEAQGVRRHERQRVLFVLCIVPLILFISIMSRWVMLQGRIPRRLYLTVSTVVFPVLFFIWVWKYAVNIPSWDDFDAILAYMCSPWAERFGRLFSQHNEHRIVTTRLVSEFSSALLGSVDFKMIAFIGNGFLLGIFYLFARTLRQDRDSEEYIPMVSAIIFMPLAWINMVWAMAGVSNNGVHFFALLSAVLFFSCRKASCRLISMGSASCAALTSASGLFIFPAILLTVTIRWLLPCSGPVREKKWAIADLVTVLVPMVGISIVYFIDYHKPSHHPSIVQSLTDPLRTIQYSLSFLGSVSDGQYASAIVGALFILYFFLLTLLGGYKKSPALCSMAVYLLITALAAAVARSGFGVGQALEIRYRICSCLLLATLLAISVRLFPALFRRHAVYIVILSVFLLRYCWCAISTVPQMSQHRSVLIIKTAKWLSFEHGLHYPEGGMEHAGHIFNSAVAKGIYRPPPCVIQSARMYDQTKDSTLSTGGASSVEK